MVMLMVMVMVMVVVMVVVVAVAVAVIISIKSPTSWRFCYGLPALLDPIPTRRGTSPADTTRRCPKPHSPSGAAGPTAGTRAAPRVRCPRPG